MRYKSWLDRDFGQKRFGDTPTLLKNWLRNSAAAHAQRAVDYLHGLQRQSPEAA